MVIFSLKQPVESSPISSMISDILKKKREKGTNSIQTLIMKLWRSICEKVPFLGNFAITNIRSLTFENILRLNKIWHFCSLCLQSRFLALELSVSIFLNKKFIICFMPKICIIWSKPTTGIFANAGNSYTVKILTKCYLRTSYLFV